MIEFEKLRENGLLSLLIEFWSEDNSAKILLENGQEYFLCNEDIDDLLYQVTSLITSKGPLESYTIRCPSCGLQNFLDALMETLHPISHECIHCKRTFSIQKYLVPKFTTSLLEEDI